jgi:hypothetical protein
MIHDLRFDNVRVYVNVESVHRDKSEVDKYVCEWFERLCEVDGTEERVSTRFVSSGITGGTGEDEDGLNANLDFGLSLALKFPRRLSTPFNCYGPSV